MLIDIAAPCPDFTLDATPGGPISREQLRGEPFVLFLYPRDNTPTCTTEAVQFSAAMPQFSALNCRVIGCSADTIASHEKFQAKHAITLPLLSDPDHVLIGALGCWVEKQLYGRRYMGIERSTFLFDADLRLRQAWRNLRVKGHVDAVIQAATQL